MGIYLRKDNWYIDYYANGIRKREKIGTSKKLAETVLQKRKVQVAEGKFLDIKREKKIKFDDFANEYLEVYSKPNNRSWKADLHNLNRLKSFFDGVCLHEITPLLVERFKVERVKEVKPATVNRALARLKSIFNKAIAWGKFNGVNPVNSVKFFPEDNQRTRYLEKEEIIKFFEYCSGNIKPIVIVALNTGMRKGEILNLKWHDIDFKRDIIYLLKTKNNSKREIPMNEAAKTALIKVKKHVDSPYIFCGKDGRPLQNIRKSFFTALEKAGIINFRFHDLRHTFASQLVMSGVDLNTVRELLGHKSLEMTLRYSHLSPDHKKRAVDVLGERIDTFWSPEVNEAKVPENTRLATVLTT
ncbi:MAG: site-specific integrase [Candidatus Omnitrophica bacterium]|nr:site-specific integrase [Candidatus Omnitrophota bacterium]